MVEAPGLHLFDHSRKASGALREFSFPSQTKKMDTNNDEILTKQELADRLKVTPWAIDKWMRQKKIPYIRLSPKCVRFNWAEVKGVLASRTIPSRRLPFAVRDCDKSAIKSWSF